MSKSTKTRDLSEEVSNIPEISPRDVLKLLNSLGITTITAQELKKFMMDLKALIAYDIKQSEIAIQNDNTISSKNNGSERPYSRPTISSKCKMTKQSGIDANKVRCKSSQSIKCSNTERSPDLNEKNIEVIKPIPDKKTFRKMKGSKNFIKVPVSNGNKKSDPVSLYNYYSSLWEKYKKNLPGENSWSELRWSIREKLLGDSQTQTVKTANNLSEEDLAKRRDNWIS